MTQIRDDWTIPPELNQPQPRPVQSTGLAHRGSVAMGLVFGLCMVFPLFVGFGQALKEERLKHGGRVTTAIITQLYTTQRHGTDYEVTYEYAYSASDDTLSGTSGVSPREYDKLHVGDRVPVVYQISEPENCNLEMNVQAINPWQRFAETAALLIGIFGGVWLILFLAAQRRYWAERHLLRYGTAVSGKIIGDREIRTQYGNSVTALYQFHDDKGWLVNGTQSGLPPKKGFSSDALARLDALVRANPTVLFDPRKPSKNMLYPAWTVRCLAPPERQ